MPLSGSGAAKIIRPSPTFPIMVGNFTVPAADLSTGLVAYWRLDEFSDGSGGVQRDDTAPAGNNFHLTDTNTVVSAAGKISLGANFVSANSERLSHADNVLLRGGNTDFSISLWCNVTENINYVLHKHLDFTILVTTTGDKFRIRTNFGGSSWQVLTASTSSKNAMTHLVCVHDSSLGQLQYTKNGGTTETFSYLGTATPTANDLLTIGSEHVSAFTSGVIDEVAFYKNRVLGESEISALWNNGAGRRPPGV